MNCRLTIHPESRFCTHCGIWQRARSEPFHAGSWSGSNPGTIEVPLEEVLLDELASVDFAIGELREALRAEAPGGDTWAKAQQWLSGLREKTVSVLVRHYGARVPEDGISGLDRLIREGSGTVQAYLTRGALRQLVGQTSAAEDDYLMAAALDPDGPEPHLRLAWLHGKLGRPTRALYSYRAYLSVQADPDQRVDAEAAAQKIERSLAAPRRHGQGALIFETPDRLAYLLDVLEELSGETSVDDLTLQRLNRRYSERLAALTAPAEPERAPESPEADQRAISTIDETSSIQAYVNLAAGAAEALPPAGGVVAGAVETFRTAANRAAVEVVEPPTPPRPPRPPRQPVNWGAMFAALLSERTLTTILAFGVLLVAVSSVALLVDQWQSSASYDDVWPRIQAILVGQFLMFLAAGHIVKERLKLRLSGLAIITLGALWVPFNIGAWMFSEFVAPGDVVLPGLGLPLDLPLVAWLVVAAVSAPAWLVLTLRYRGHLLTHGTIAAVGATVALALAVLGLGWEWSVASLAIVALPLIVIWRGFQGTAFEMITAPLFWTSQVVLLAVSGILFGFWATGVTESYPLATAGMAGSGLYVLAFRYTSQRRYEYLLVGLPAVSLLSALGESGLVPVRYLDAPLFVLGVAYLLIGHTLRGRYGSGVLNRWQALQPSRAIGYVLLAGAAVWPEFDQVSRMAVLCGITAVAAVSARAHGQPQWTWLAAALLVVPYLLALDLLGWMADGYAAPALGLLAIAYLGAAVMLRRAQAHAMPLVAGAFALAAAGTASAFSYDPLAEPRLPAVTLPVVLVTLGGLWAMAHAGRDEALLQTIGFIRRALGYGEGPVDREVIRRTGVAFFAILVGAIASLWTTMVRLWADLPDQWVGVDLMGIAAVSALVSVRLRARGSGLEASVLQGWVLVLAVAAPVYHAASVGVDWGLAGILYAEVALAALGGLPIRHSRAVSLAAWFVPVPVALTLFLGGVAATGWSVWWALLGLINFAVAMTLGRRNAAAPILGLACVLGVGAAVWAAVTDPAGPAALWTLPLVAAMFGAAAVVAHRHMPGNVDGLFQRIVAPLGLELASESRRYSATIVFGALATGVVAGWVAALLVWSGVSGPVHAYNLLGWAFALALLPVVLRRYATEYVVASLAASGAAACGAIVTALAFPEIERPVITGVLFGVAALGGLFRVHWRRPEPIYFAAAVLPAPFLLTLDLAGVDSLLWGTPVMAMAIGYLVLALALHTRFTARSVAPLAHVGWIASVVAVGWTSMWAAARLAGIAPDTALTLTAERLFASLTLLLGAAAYAIAAYRLGDRRLAHVSAWVFAAGVGIALVATPLSMRHVANVVAGLAFASALAGALLEILAGRAGRHGSFANVFAGPVALGGYGAAAVAIMLASLDLFSRGGEVWSANATYLIVVAMLALSGYLRRVPAFVTLASGLFVLPFTLGVYDVWGESGRLAAMPSAALAFGWTALAMVYLGAGAFIERRQPGYAAGPVVMGYLLLASAVYASLGSAARQSVVFGAVVLVAIASAIATHRRLTTVLPALLAGATWTSRDSAQRYIAAAFAWVASLLSPLWALELLALFTTDVSTQGLVLALLAPPFLMLAAGLAGKGMNRYSRPLHFAGFGMTLVAAVLTWPEYGQAVTALALGSVTMLISAYRSPRRRLSFGVQSMATVFLTLTLFRAASPLGLSREAFGLAVLLLAIAYTAGSLLAVELSRGRQPVLAWTGAGLALSVVGILLALPTSSDAWPVSTATWAIAAVFFAVLAFRLGVPILLYPAVGTATASYSLGLAMMSVESQYVGLALVPGGIAALSLGWVLYRHKGQSANRAPTPNSFRGMIGKLRRGVTPLGAHGPLLIVGYGLMLAAPALSAPYEVQRLLALLALAGTFAASMFVFRSWRWLYPLLFTAHLAWASLIALPALGLQRPSIGLLFVPAVVAMVAMLGAVAGREGAAAGRGQDQKQGLRDLGRLIGSPLGPFMIFFAVDLVTSIVLSSLADWSGIVMSVTYAVLTTIAAQRTRIRLLPYASTAFITGAVIFTSRLLGLSWSQSAVVWATQGLLMWWASQAARYLVDRGSNLSDPSAAPSLWQQPLRNAGLRLSWFALAFVVAMLCLGVVVPDRFGSSMTDASAVMAILGLLYVGMAFVARRVWFGYVAVALLLGSWTIQAIDLEIPNAQAYAIPAGLYLFGLSYFERRRLAGPESASTGGTSAGRSLATAGLPALLEFGAVSLIVGSAFWQSAVDQPGWPYAVLLAVESIALVLWGAANRSRFSSLGGVIAFVANVLYQTGDLLVGMSGAVVGLTIGLAIVALIAGLERKRAQLIRIGREWTSPAGPWRW